jgi:ABC-type transport system involved in multi-copper enzyme maturation permease subunit
MEALRRIWTFAVFTFAEYVRSGRIVIELAATVLFWTLFLRQFPVGLDQFFSLTGIFTLLLTLYTTASLLSLGERPQGYVMLTRPLGRAGYLLGLYAVALFIVLIMFVLVVGLTLIANRPLDLLGTSASFMLSELGKGALPLLLNVGLLGALMVLLSSLVLSNVWRLALLAVLAIALYSNAWNLSPLFPYIQPLQSLFSWPIYPAIAGFRLATTREWSGAAPYVMLAQLAMTVLLLSLALSSFKRRDLVLRNQ